jgi:phosphatidylserine/phosphatidylglycerophosphate/cardiolipin synthase-like enzyme
LFGMTLLNNKCEAELGNNPFKTPATEVGTVRLATGDMLHHKFAVVDNEKVIFGSHNWSESANHLNDETLLVIKDRTVAKAFREQYNYLLSISFLGVPYGVERTINEYNQNCRNSSN